MAEQKNMKKPNKTPYFVAHITVSSFTAPGQYQIAFVGIIPDVRANDTGALARRCSSAEKESVVRGVLLRDAVTEPAAENNEEAICRR
jgi:hypothetical protein